MSAQPPIRARVSIGAFVAAFSLLGLLSVAAISLLAWLQLESAHQSMEQGAQSNARAELQIGLQAVAAATNDLATSFREWEETRQHLENATYYEYWLTQRVVGARFLPDGFVAVELYRRDGAPLRPAIRAMMPARVDGSVVGEPALLADSDTVLARGCQAVHDPAHVRRHLGYVCVALDFIATLAAVNTYYYLEPASVAVPAKAGEAALPVTTAAAQLRYSVRAQREWQTVHDLLLDTLFRYGLLVLSLIALLTYLLTVSIGGPLRRLSGYIDRLDRDAGAGPEPTVSAAFIREIDKMYRSLGELHQRLWWSNAELRRSEEHFRGLIENSSDMIAILGADAVMRYLSPSVGRLLGYQSDELVGHSLARIVRQGELAVLRPVLAGITAVSGSVPLPEFTVLDRQGQPHVLDAVARFLPSGRGMPAGVVINARDITRRKRAEKELAAARDHAVAANRAKSDFLANMSHELRTPLNAVMGYSELLMEDLRAKGNPEYIPDLERIYRSGEHLLSLINEVLDLTRVEAGQITVVHEDIDIRNLIEHVVDNVRPLLGANGNHLDVICPPDVGSMESDTTKLSQVLLNLLGNAAKFTHNGVITFTVARVGNPPDDEISFQVRDTGIGMTEAQMARIFEPFYQADMSTTRAYSGTGLGLAITHGFVTRLGGRIDVASQVGEGSVFTVSFPAQVSRTTV